jgi:MFS family permease
LVTFALKVNSLVGIGQAPKSLAVVTGVGALLAMVGNPFFGRLSDRTTSRLGASVGGTFLVQLLTGNRLAMFLAPCPIGGFFVLLFAARLNDRRLAKADKPAWSLRELASTCSFKPRTSPGFAGRSPAASCSCWPTPS